MSVRWVGSGHMSRQEKLSLLVQLLACAVLMGAISGALMGTLIVLARAIAL